MTTSAPLRELLSRRILVLDGAMGTMVQRSGLDEQAVRGERFRDHPHALRHNIDLLVLTRPALISSIHHAYLEAGADIIETNTFAATAIAQADFGLEPLVHELNVAAAHLARDAAAAWTAQTPDRPRFVAGAIGPTPGTLSMAPDIRNPAYRAVTFAHVRDGYRTQVRGLMEGGVDLLLLETVVDTLNAKAAIVAILDEFDAAGRELPVMISATVTASSGRTLSGQTLEAFYVSIRHLRPLSVGLNCAFGARQMRPHIAELSRLVDEYVSCHPNAGLPNASGGYDETPADIAAHLRDFAAAGWLNIAGGCCGTTPEHIRAIGDALEGLAPRQRAPIARRSTGQDGTATNGEPVSSRGERFTQYAGLEALTIRPDSGLIIVGERTNVAGSKRFAAKMAAGHYTDAAAIALDQVRGGADILDINMDGEILDSERAMTRFLNAVAMEPEIARLPFMIDSVRWPVIEAGLQCVQGKAIANSISLAEGEDAFLEKARIIARYGAALVVMAIDERGHAGTARRKIEICERAYRLLVDRLDEDPLDIIFDLDIPAIATGVDEDDSRARDVIEAARVVKSTCPGVRICGGISDLSSAFRGNAVVRAAMHSAFLTHATAAGLDIAILNAGQLPAYENIAPDLLEHVEDVILHRRHDATARLVQFAAAFAGTRGSRL